MIAQTKGREGFALAASANEIYVTGGTITGTDNGINNSVIKFNLSDCLFKFVSAMHHARAYHSSTVVGDKLVVIGGSDGGSNLLDSIELINLMQWAAPEIIKMNRGISYASVVAIDSTNILICGGWTASSEATSDII